MSNPVDLKAMRLRLKMNPTQAAAYLGVSVHGYRKWESGHRVPGGPAQRLLAVLGVIETLAPDLHRNCLPDDEKTS